MSAGPIYICPCEKREMMQSQHRHDYHPCSCGDTAIDGGSDYVRLVGDNKNRFPYRLGAEGPPA